MVCEDVVLVAGWRFKPWLVDDPVDEDVVVEVVVADGLVDWVDWVDWVVVVLVLVVVVTGFSLVICPLYEI